MEQLHGLFTCDDCGALCDLNGTEKHVNWHKEVNEAFMGTVKLFERLTKAVERLSSER